MCADICGLIPDDVAHDSRIVPLWLEFVRVYQAELPHLEVDSVEAEKRVVGLTESFREWRLDLERVWRAAL